MSLIEASLEVVALAYSAGQSEYAADGITVRRMSGGWNNILYCVDVDDAASMPRRYACKLCVNDERRRAAREFGCLSLLQKADCDLAAEPLWLDESCSILPYPVVIYRWLEGEPLGPALTQAQLEALLASVQRMHALRPGCVPGIALSDAVFHWFDYAPYLAELGRMLDRHGAWLQEADPDGSDLYARLASLVERSTQILGETDVDPGRTQVMLGLVRADVNLANAIWAAQDGGGNGRVRWVDWEYGGWGDPALDVAELNWHIALDELTAEQRAWLGENYECPAGDATFERRVEIWNCLLAARWPLLILRFLWSAYNGPDRLRLTWPDVNPQVQRERLIRYIERGERMVGWSGG